jgi:hypothetical protein
MLISLDPMVGSDWCNHVRMVITPYSTASCVHYLRSDSIGQLGGWPLYITKAPVLHHMSQETQKHHRERVISTDRPCGELLRTMK